MPQWKAARLQGCHQVRQLVFIRPRGIRCPSTSVHIRGSWTGKQATEGFRNNFILVLQSCCFSSFSAPYVLALNLSLLAQIVFRSLELETPRPIAALASLSITQLRFALRSLLQRPTGIYRRAPLIPYYWAVSRARLACAHHHADVKPFCLS